MTVCERPPRFPHGGWTVAVSTLHACPCVWMSTRWDVLGQFLENQLPSSNRHGQQLDLAFLCWMWPTSAHVQSSAEWSGCPWAATSHAPGPAGHIGQRARAGSGTLGCSLGHLLPPCPSDAQHSVPHVSSGWGDDMNVTGGDTFCLCFKESDVPFVNIQEKY